MGTRLLEKKLGLYNVKIHQQTRRFRSVCVTPLSVDLTRLDYLFIAELSSGTSKDIKTNEVNWRIFQVMIFKIISHKFGLEPTNYNSNKVPKVPVDFAKIRSRTQTRHLLASKQRKVFKISFFIFFKIFFTAYERTTLKNPDNFPPKNNNSWCF